MRSRERGQYLAMNLHDRDMIKIGEREGIAKGAQQKALETAQKLLADGKYTAEEISGLLGIPVEAFAQPDSAQA